MQENTERRCATVFTLISISNNKKDWDSQAETWPARRAVQAKALPAVDCPPWPYTPGAYLARRRRRAGRRGAAVVIALGALAIIVTVAAELLGRG